jgi:hypothetical protein
VVGESIETGHAHDVAAVDLVAGEAVEEAAPDVVARCHAGDLSDMLRCGKAGPGLPVGGALG